jgi:tyrosyl-tRNA synthetase
MPDARSDGPESARVPTEAELDWITRRAVAEIIPYEDFVKALRSGRSLRLKMGFDPSAPDLTLGHAVGLRKLRQLQDLGHRVVIIVGDWTARIGDPSGVSKTRPMLTEEQVKANAETYLKQFFRIVDREMTEVRWQSEWFNDFTLTNVVRLAAKFTVAQMLERADFAERFATQKPISIHELLYPLLQAYDSVAVKADVEFGGTDQKFNLMVGRELQPDFEQKPQIVYTVPLLVGTDGEIKMSKSLGNYVAVEDPPNEMYGKLMSVPDHLIFDYFELLTDVSETELKQVEDIVRGKTGHPGIHLMNLKLRLAHAIVAQFHSEAAAEGAAKEFERVFMNQEIPADITEFGLDLREPGHWTERGLPLARILHSSGMASSISEANRLIRQGAVERLRYGAVGPLPPEKVLSALVPIQPNDVFRIGKHRFLRIVQAPGKFLSDESTPETPRT